MNVAHTKNRKPIVVAYGEALWDMFPAGAVLGGAPLNFAYRVNSLGLRGVIVSKVGDDNLGRKALEQIASLGMDTSFIGIDFNHPTGTVPITLDEKRNPSYVIVEGVAYDHIECTKAVEDLVMSADCLCFGTLIQRSYDSRRTLYSLLDRFTGKYRLLDINLRKNCYSNATISSSVARCNIIKLNDDEVPVVADVFGYSHDIEAFAESMVSGHGLESCIITMGKRGAFAMAKNGERTFQPGYVVEVADTCGSGDAFTAAFLCALFEHKGLEYACRFGNALGAMVAAQKGATQPVSRREVEEFMGSAKTV